MQRRDFLNVSGLAPFSLPSVRPPGLRTPPVRQGTKRARVTLRIAPITMEIGLGKIIKTVGYNRSAPGPVFRLAEGKLVTGVFNDSDVPEVVHRHGQKIAPAVDGSVEEGTPAVPRHGHRRFRFTPKPAGTRWYHTHIMAHADLTRAGFSGQYGFATGEPVRHPGIRNSASRRTIGSHRWPTRARPITVGIRAKAPGTQRWPERRYRSRAQSPIPRSSKSVSK
jgi:FtsP/CotA-like multicopper oxidase with cupredoxin domain